MEYEQIIIEARCIQTAAIYLAESANEHNIKEMKENIADIEKLIEVVKKMVTN